MNTYLLTVGWWNLLGSLMMLGFLYEPFGKKMLNEWTFIFKEPFSVDYWSKLWLFWAVGLNIFFGLINIMAGSWDFLPLKSFLILADLVSYTIFVGLCLWGYKESKLGVGVYTVFAIFGVWISWGLYVLSV